MEQQSEMTWVSIKVLTYYDPETTATLNVSMESGVAVDDKNRKNYIAPRLKFHIRESKINADLNIDLHFSDLLQMGDKFSKIEEDLNGSFRNSSNIVFYKYYAKNRKELLMTLGVDDRNKPYVKLVVVDPSSTRSDKLSMFLDYNTYRAITGFVKQFGGAYAVVSSNMMQLCGIDKYISHIAEIHKDIENLKHSFLEQLGELPTRISQENGKYIKRDAGNSVEKADVEFLPCDTPESSTEASPNEGSDSFFRADFQNDFVSSLDLDSIHLDGEESAPNKIVTEKKVEKKKEYNKPIMSFIGKFLSYNPNSLVEWVYSVINSNHKTEPSSFLPITNIEKLCLGTDVLNDVDVYKAQYFLNVLFRNNVRKYLETATFDKIPVFKFSEEIYRRINSEEYYKFCGEISFIYAIYTMIIQKHLSTISGLDDSNRFVNATKIVHNFVRTFLLSFPVGCSDRDKLKKHMWEAATLCSENGFLDKLSNEYSKYTMGGTLVIKNSLFENMINNFVSQIDNISSYEIKEFENKINYKFKMTNEVKDKLSVKEGVLADLGIIDDSTIKNVTEEIDDDSIKLNLFFECIKKYIDPLELEKLKSNCKQFSSVSMWLREHNFSEDVIRVKRVMDLNPNFKKRSEILNACKEFKEDPVVTENRVLMNDELGELEGIDGIDFEQMLFSSE